MVVVPSTKEEAIVLGEKFYFTGESCRNGHIDKRYANTGICYACKRGQAKRDYENHKDRVTETNNRSNVKCQEKVNARNNRWVSENRDRSNAIKRAYKIRHRERCLESARRHQRKKRQDPVFRLSRAMSKAVWAWLKGSKGYRHWEDVVGFTVEDLKSRLEPLFKEDMNWENYGTVWEVDHIKPLSLCLNFEEAWQLSNLQPLYCSENASKGNRWIG